MTLQHTEVAVVGGGMVGGALALGLAKQGFEVTVIEQSAPPTFDPASKPDVRISAISAASVDLLVRFTSNIILQQVSQLQSVQPPRDVQRLREVGKPPREKPIRR